MPRKPVAAVFRTVEDAERAQARLLESGLAAGRISISRRLTMDDIAAEAPGQSYFNQANGETAAEREQAAYVDAVHAAGAVLTVAPGAKPDAQTVAELLRRHGARQVR